MSSPKYKDLEAFDTSLKIEEEILRLQAFLCSLRIQKNLGRTINSDVFRKTRRQIAQLMFKKNSIIQS